MIPGIQFALARFRQSWIPQEAEVIAFADDGIRLHSGGRVLRNIPWDQVQEIRFVHPRIALPGMLQMFSGNLFGRNEAFFEIIPAEGPALQLNLELDALYRRMEIIDLLKGIYKSGISLREETTLGNPTFLLEKVRVEEIPALIAHLRS